MSIEIEIITTKKKLSKSIVKQLEKATLEDFHHFNQSGEKGFYVRDIGSKMPVRVGLIKGVKNWVRFNLTEWKKVKDSASLTTSAKSLGSPRGYLVMDDFKTEDEANEYLDEYQKVYDKCVDNYLIL